MEKIVYILGAGFSAPLGLPVMNNFLEKSKDLYHKNIKNKDKYDYFEDIYNILDKKFPYVKSFMHSNLLNIEEVVSILEMQDFLGDDNSIIEKCKNFIKAVILENTPPRIELPKSDIIPADWEEICFGKDSKHKLYGYFIANLFQLRLGRIEKNKPGNKYSSYRSLVPNSRPEIKYSIITLNYDNILENIVEYINKNFPLKGGYKLSFSSYNKEDNNENPMKVVLDKDERDLTPVNKLDYTKLHGSVDSDIILPTWNKNAAAKVRQIWRSAYEILKDANQIRILGYSLPESDNYVRFLLSTGIINSNLKHIKKIDVITLDTDNKTENRYKKMFVSPPLRFRNERIESYLENIYINDKKKIRKKIKNRKSGSISEYEVIRDSIALKPELLEGAHEEFMNTKS